MWRHVLRGDDLRAKTQSAQMIHLENEGRNGNAHMARCCVQVSRQGLEKWNGAQASAPDREFLLAMGPLRAPSLISCTCEPWMSSCPFAQNIQPCQAALFASHVDVHRR
eukprot:6187864-Pleurochrysis_carterae.AAC.2